MTDAQTLTQPPPPPRLALVGDRSPAVRAHDKIPEVLQALARQGAEPLEAYWLHSTTISEPADLAGFDGIWAIPGSPYEHADGVIAAVEAARVNAVPFLGTCGGFQHMLLEFARNVCGLRRVEHGETNPDAPEQLIVPLACSLLGEEGVVIVAPGTLAATAMSSGSTTERYFCRYGLSDSYRDVMQLHGMVFSGRDEGGDVRVAELPGHPFFLGTLFQPELSSDTSWVHPVLRAFTDAVRTHAARRGAAAAVQS